MAKLTAWYNKENWQFIVRPIIRGDKKSCNMTAMGYLRLVRPFEFLALKELSR